jgi:hypothetical protein
VHDHARRLVDHDEVGVLVEDRERQVFGDGGRAAGSGSSIVNVWPAFDRRARAQRLRPGR